MNWNDVKKQDATQREIQVVVMPNGTLRPEWSDTDDIVIENSRLLQEEIYKRTTTDDWLLYLGFSDKDIALSPSVDFFRNFADHFVRTLCLTPELETIRHNIKVPVEDRFFEETLAAAPLMIGAEYLCVDYLKDYWDQLNQCFCKAISDFEGTVEEFCQSFSPHVHLVGRIFFHLVENKNPELPFAFMSTYTMGLDQAGKSKHLPLKHALGQYGQNSRKILELLVTVQRAAQKSSLIAEILESGEIFHPLAWSVKEAFTFLKEVAWYEQAGILCRIPNWWKGRTSNFNIQVKLGDQKPSKVGLDALLNFNSRLYIGDDEISIAEARRLLKESEGLAFLKGRWVVAAPEKIEKTLQVFEKVQKLMSKGGLTLREALRLQMDPSKYLDLGQDDEAIGISNGDWLQSIMEKLRAPEKLEPVRIGDGFKAELRPYQEKGVNWLWFLHRLQFGACLADDMGLGKTIQILGFLSMLKKDRASRQASLLIIPASLIANWTNEIKRFAPTLKYHIAHAEGGSQNSAKQMTAADLDKLDLVITTYAMAQKHKWIGPYTWRYIILDEAQAIKNPGTKQTKAIKKLSAQNRIILTGTPVENRLSDLWSLFDFLNPGLLGNSKEFGAFAKSLKDNPTGYGRLRQVIKPYILRRLKTDRSVITDLPDKVEMKTYTTLSKKQVILYEQLIADIKFSIENSDGIKRKGLVLAALMKFKQICNHPDQFLGTGGFTESDSGKFSRLREICETVLEKREQALVFTQFKEMAEPLREFLSGVFGREGLVLHGSVPVAKRKKLIEAFQGADYIPFMVLSLKAGGVGLNLTAANHVIHFDRWWNPAVENQATDRAFRIGQQKNVMVHKFVTRGTVEEKIDKMIEEKTDLSRKLITGSTEAWVTEMDNGQLMDLFRLSL